MKRRVTTYKARSWRHYAVLSLFLLVGTLLFGRILFLGETEKIFLQTAGKSSESLETFPGVRGNIFDRNSDALTRNIAHYTLSINPSKVNEKELLAQLVSQITNNSKARYIKKINSSKSFEYLARNIRISQEDVNALENFNGLHVSKKYRRSYPHGMVASQLLGYNLSLIHI